MQQIRLIPDPFWSGERLGRAEFVAAAVSAGVDRATAAASYDGFAANDSSALEVPDRCDLRRLADALKGFTIILPEEDAGRP